MICSNDEHPEKELFPILVTDDGILIWFNDEHPSKAFSPIDVADDGTKQTLVFV